MRITNCHVHSFTLAHVPKWYPHPALHVFRTWPRLLWLLKTILRYSPYSEVAERVERLYQFQAAGRAESQRTVLDAVMRLYPPDARFVVLPMDMAPIGYGPVRIDLPAQHDELAALAAEPRYRDRIVPFATLHPGRPDALAEFRRMVEEHGFRGLKIYPRLGFAPDHPVLMQAYEICAARGLPVMTHCSRGGVRGHDCPPARADAFTDPAAYAPVMRAFPDLRLCLAHFGGDYDWDAYLVKGLDPDDPEARKANWLTATLDMIRSGEWPNLYTDISYTIFNFEPYIPLLRTFLEDAAVRRRVLFGSDYYMIKQEALPERAVSFRLRDALGPELFRRIAETNPEVWLGERAEPGVEPAVDGPPPVG